MPAASCPSTIGNGIGQSPFMMCQSLMHTPAALTCTRTSFAFGGSCSRSRICRGLVNFSQYRSSHVVFSLCCRTHPCSTELLLQLSRPQRLDRRLAELGLDLGPRQTPVRSQPDPPYDAQWNVRTSQYRTRASASKTCPSAPGFLHDPPPPTPLASTSKSFMAPLARRAARQRAP